MLSVSPGQPCPDLPLFSAHSSMAQIILRDVSVDFTIYDFRAQSLRHFFVLDRVAQTVISRKRRSAGGAISNSGGGLKVIKALDSLSLRFNEGDRVGLVGHNGAGKTTLLRVLAGIYEPTAGQVITHGQVVPLFDLNEAVTPDATGHEMIKIRGRLMGLSSNRLTSYADDVSEFCELGEYLQMPLRTYSAGMLVRLTFAIVTAVSPDILLMDEVINAGDSAFIDKAQARLRRFIERSSIVVVASHSAEMLKTWCTKAVLLRGGRVVEVGPVEDILALYAQKPGEAAA